MSATKQFSFGKKSGRPKLRLLGASLTLFEPILRQASADIGVELEVTLSDGVAALRKAVTEPDSFDVFDQWFDNIEFLWTGRCIQPINVNRLSHWREVGPLAKTGRLKQGLALAEGASPNKRLFVRDQNELGGEESENISMLPLTHAADSFAYMRGELPPGYDIQNESWSWLVSPDFEKIAFQGSPAIGGVDCIKAFNSANSLECNNISNITVPEIDTLINNIKRARRNGQKIEFWDVPADLIELITKRRAQIFSFWSPARHSPQLKGMDIRIAEPKEGYRAWFGGMAISRYCTGKSLDAAYDLLNWWLEGEASVWAARQGYYFSAPSRAKAKMNVDEWNYWYMGQPAARDLPTNYNGVVIEKGHFLEGGSYENRMSKIAIWNTVMDEHNYLTRRWSELTR